MENNRLFKVRFINQGSVYEVYSRYVSQCDLYGFIEIEELVFGENAAVVVDPSEEKLKTEFEGVQRSYIPMHSVIRIDEVEKRGSGKITEIKGKGGTVSPFPGPLYSPSKD